ncbi:4-hydroxy-tetrahydrodipicolinate reductase [Parvularcula dongshanensis]|uniref:4-hydroxy-tetrahydrodipicolinate reductase n=1 Tax=Parvularcula dongshanensis TaxID=1173995 RepID=UPI0031B565C9
MPARVKVAVLGQGGRTGGAVARLCDAAEGFDRLGWSDRNAAPQGTEVVIDFSAPAALASQIGDLAERGVPVVTGTTGLDEAQQARLAAAATRIPIVQSGNFSTGVVILAALVAQASRLLGDDFDIEITETHHKRKKDAPSGTALLLGEAAAAGRGASLADAATFARQGNDAVRKAGEIGFATRRGGGVPGDHDVAFLAEEEVVTLSHRALNREVFARGALRAAVWVRTRPPGLYAMTDVLGL